MVDTRESPRVKPPAGATRGFPRVTDTIGEERSPSWPRAPHWKCGIPRQAVSRVRIPLAPDFHYSIRDFASGCDRNFVGLLGQLRPLMPTLMPTDPKARIVEAMRKRTNG